MSVSSVGGGVELIKKERLIGLTGNKGVVTGRIVPNIEDKTRITFAQLDETVGRDETIDSKGWPSFLVTSRTSF